MNVLDVVMLSFLTSFLDALRHHFLSVSSHTSSVIRSLNAGASTEETCDQLQILEWHKSVQTLTG